ncbi:MAG: CCA tRNA nucleotidyltransferase [Paracoccaceae bacterium]
MKITGDWISADTTQAVLGALTDAGFQALLVGGCVRNALMGAPITDIDIATDARPEQIMETGAQAGLRVVPTGLDHGTITLIAGGIAHEVTTFRRDVETDGRHAVVAFSDRVEDDARRRDFTMNALYARADGSIVDPLGGLADLRAGRLRFIEDPDARIREDYLRILRFFRFHAWYGAADGGIDPDGLAACAANAAGLAGISRERIGAEMLKLLAAPAPGQSVAAMAQSGVLARILPGASLRAFLPLLQHEAEQNTAPDPLRRLAALGGEDAARLWRLSRVQARDLAILRDTAAGGMDLHEAAYRFGAYVARNVALLRAAMFEAPLSPSAQTDIALGAAARFPLRAADLTLTGKALGQELKRLERIWIDARFAPDRAALLSLATGGAS